MTISHHYILCVALFLSNYVSTTPFYQHPGRVPEDNPDPRNTNTISFPLGSSPEIELRFSTIVKNDNGNGEGSSSISNNAIGSPSLPSPSETTTPPKKEATLKEILDTANYNIMHGPGTWRKLVLIFGSFLILVGVAGILIFSFTILLLLLITWKFQNLLGKMFVPIMVWRVIHLIAAFSEGIVELDDNDEDKLEHSKGDKKCHVFALLYCFAMLTDFAWLVMINFNFWLDLGRKWPTVPHPNPTIRRQQEGLKYFKYSLFGWGVPVLILGASLSIDKLFGIQESLMGNVSLESESERLICSLGRGLEVILYAWPSIAVFMCAILTFAILTMKSIREQQRETKFARESRRGSSISNFQLFWKLSILMGLEMVFHNLFYIHLVLIYLAVDKKYVDGEGALLLYMGGGSVVIGLSYISSSCLLHFFLWSKRELVTGQAKQVFQDCWTWMGSCMGKKEGRN